MVSRAEWLTGSCLSCSYCLNGDEPQCPKALLSGYTVNGTFQQYATGKAIHLTKVQKDCDLTAITPILCPGLTVYKGLKESTAHPTGYITLIGAGGGLGSLSNQYDKAMGLSTTAEDGGVEKGECCKTLGADIYVDYIRAKGLVHGVKVATPDGHDSHSALVLAAKTALEFYRAGLVKVVVTVVPLSKMSDMFDLVSPGDIMARYVVDTFE